MHIRFARVEAHRAERAAAIDALLHPTALDVNIGVALHTACATHGSDRPRDLASIIDRYIVRSHSFAVVVTTQSTAVNVAPDGAVLDGYFRILGHGAVAASAIHITHNDDSGAINLDFGILHLCSHRPMGIDAGGTQKRERTQAAAIHIASHGGSKAVEFRFVVIADGAAANLDGGLAYVAPAWHLTIQYIIFIAKLEAHRTITSTTIDGTEDLAALDFYSGIAAHSACGVGFGREATTATEDVAVVAGIAPGADDRACQNSTYGHRRMGFVIGCVGNDVADGQLGIAKHVAVLTAAKDGAEDGATSDVDHSLIHIGPFVGPITLVALACAKEVADEWVTIKVGLGTWHTDGAASHVDGCFAHHVGGLVGTIDRTEDVATTDFDKNIAPHTACRASPNARTEGIETAAATKQVAEIGVAVTTC